MKRIAMLMDRIPILVCSTNRGRHMVVTIILLWMLMIGHLIRWYGYLPGSGKDAFFGLDKDFSLHRDVELQGSGRSKQKSWTGSAADAEACRKAGESEERVGQGEEPATRHGKTRWRTRDLDWPSFRAPDVP